MNPHQTATDGCLRRNACHLVTETQNFLNRFPFKELSAVCGYFYPLKKTKQATHQEDMNPQLFSAIQ